MSSLTRSPVIAATDLGHRFSSNWLFRHLDFQLELGRLVGVCGPSGSGKSTLLGIVATWIKPTEGTLIRRDLERVSWVFQNPHGSTRRSALDHVTFPLLAQGQSLGEAETNAFSLMVNFDLVEVAHRPFGSLSGGEAQRLMLARAVASNPDALLIDEPTAQLDRAAASRVNATIKHVADQGSMVMIASHDPDTIAVCDTVINFG